jgi:RecB family exonuclease
MEQLRRYAHGVRSFVSAQWRAFGCHAVAPWSARRHGGDVRVLGECTGRHTLDAPVGPFTVTAKADRIEQLGDGRFTIVDHKTGPAPSETAIWLADSTPYPPARCRT